MDIVVEYELLKSKEKRPYLRESKVYYNENDSCNTCDKASSLLNKCFHICDRDEEYVYLIALDNCLNVKGLFEISHGTANTSLCTPREIYQRALMIGAVSIIVAHNHPSGNVSPSGADKETFRRLKEAGGILGVELLDFIIIGNDPTENLSFAENHIS